MATCTSRLDNVEKKQGLTALFFLSLSILKIKHKNNSQAEQKFRLQAAPENDTMSLSKESIFFRVHMKPFGVCSTGRFCFIDLIIAVFSLQILPE